MHEQTEKLALTLFHLGVLSPAAARLLVDVEDGEPVAVADVAAIHSDLENKPTFFGGLLKNRPRHSAHIKRSQETAIPN